MYAIIATGGKQYKVAEGDVIKVEKLGVAAGEAVVFDQVLAVNNGEMKIGCPTVDGASVSATVVKEGKGKKVIATMDLAESAHASEAMKEYIKENLEIEWALAAYPHICKKITF